MHKLVHALPSDPISSPFKAKAALLVAQHLLGKAVRSETADITLSIRCLEETQHYSILAEQVGGELPSLSALLVDFRCPAHFQTAGLSLSASEYSLQHLLT